jgi:hypothetical protein
MDGSSSSEAAAGLTPFFENVPLAWAVLGVAAAAAVGQVVALVIARRRLATQRAAGQAAGRGDWTGLANLPVPAPWLELVAVVLAIAPLAMAAISMTTARAMIRHALVLDADASVKAGLLSRGLTGEMWTVAVAVWPVWVVGALACFTIGMAMSGRLRATGLRHAAEQNAIAPQAALAWLRHPGPTPSVLVGALAALAALGLGPVFRGAIAAVSIQIKAFTAVRDAHPGDKLPIISAALTESSEAARAGLADARLGVLLATVMVAVLAIAASPARARARLLDGAAPPPPPARRRQTVGLATALLAAAATLFLVAQPLRRENETPWPPHHGDAWQLRLPLVTPVLDGPDAIERAPLVTLGEGLRLDGVDVDASDLAERLRTLRRNHQLLETGTPFGGMLLLACTGDTPVAAVQNALAIGLDAGYPRPAFVFTKPMVIDRPLLGRFPRNLSTTAQTEVVQSVDAAPGGATVVVPEQHRRCADLAARVVKLRTEGKNVALVVGRPRF